MPKYAFQLSGEDVPAGASAVRNPGVLRIRLELARTGSLGAGFDNNCAARSASPGRVFGNRARRAEE